MPQPHLPRRTTIEIQQLLAAYQSSGQTRAAFCAAHHLPLSTLDSYRRRAPSPPDSFAIVLRNGRRLELTWSPLPHIADQLADLLLRLEA